MRTSAASLTLVAALTLHVLVDPSTVTAQDIALSGATIHTAAGQILEGATIVVREGKITALGTDVSVPDGVSIFDASGKTVIPGMLDNHSHIGFDIRDVNERSTTFTPRYRAIDVLSPDERYWYDAVDGGVTTIVTGPGSGSVSSGQSAVVKTWGDDWEARILDPSGGLKIAMGAKRPHTGTSMATTALLRERFIQAGEYQAQKDAWTEGGEEGPAPAVNLDLEVLADILRGDNRVRAHVHSAHDILSLLRLKDEFGFNLTLHHATEAYKVADEIAAREVPVVGVPLFIRIGLVEEVMRAPAYLVEKGILFAFHTDDPVVMSKHQRYNAALAIRYGMAPDDALQALTINAARIAQVDDRVGSLEVGKDGDFVVIDGPWYELTSRIDRVYVDGRLAYDREAEEDR
ncbi:MAG: amidohydrolase family protein [Gemmatimonadota bacterium]|nr:amidohydrolase family protein [Gemmatimonadota bacterium]